MSRSYHTRTVDLVAPRDRYDKPNGTPLGAHCYPKGWELTVATELRRSGFERRPVTLRELLRLAGDKDLRAKIKAVHMEVVRDERWRLERQAERVAELEREARRQRWRIPG